MNNKLVKIVSVLAVVLLGISLAACGKKDPENNVDSVDDGYGYVSTFTEIKIPNLTEDEYISNEQIIGEDYYYIKEKIEEAETDSDEEKINTIYTLHKFAYKTGEDKEIDIDFSVIKSEESIRDIVIKEDGYVFMVSSYDEKTYSMKYRLVKFSKEGKFDSELLLDSFINGNDSYISDIAVSADGSICINCDTKIIGVSSEGKKEYEIAIDGYVRSTLVTEDGTTYVTRYDMEKGIVLSKIDKKSGSFSEDYTLGNSVDNIYPGRDGSLILSGSVETKRLDVKTGNITPLWNWFEVDAANDYFSAVTENADESFSFLYTEWDDRSGDRKTFLMNIKRELLTEENRKINISLGCLYLDYSVRSLITDFNKSNPKYRVIPKIYENDSDWEGAIKQLNLDITSGKLDMADLSYSNTNTLIKAGVFEDLYPYIKKDLNMADYFENVFETFSTDGKLYFATPFVSVNTMISPKSLVGDKKVISMKEIMELRKKYPNIPFFNYGTKEEVFLMSLVFSTDNYIDYKTGKCNFLSEDFYTMLEFANTFPESINYETYDEWAELQNKNVLFCTLSLDEMQSYQLYKILMGEELSVIGFPTSSDSGNVMSANSCYAIISSSKNKDGAWEFVKALLSEDAQKDGYGLPVLRSAFDTMMKEAMTPEYITDEDGKKTEVPKTTWGNGSTEVEIFAASQQDVDLVKATYEATHNTYSYDEKVLEMIEEEVAPFFKGQKTAQEVAQIIQSRVTIYLAESN